MNSSIPQSFKAVTCDYVMAGMLPLYSDAQLHCVIRFNTRLEAERLARAVRLSVDAEPVLGCNLLAEGNRLYWQRATYREEAYFSQVQSDDTDTVLRQFLCRPLDATNEPLVQACLIRGEQEVLVLKVCHFAADGGAMKTYAYLLAAIYRQLQHNPAYQPPVNLGSRSLRQISRHFSLIDKLKILRRGWRNNQVLVFSPQNWRLPLQPLRTQPDYLWRYIEAPQFQALKAYGEQQSATVHELLLTAMLRALHQRLSPPDEQVMRLINTADLRRHIPGGQAEAICNLSGPIYLDMGTDLGADFATTLAKVNAAMTREKQDYIGLGEIPRWLYSTQPLFSGLRQWLQKPQKYDPNPLPFAFTPALTNIGMIDSQRLDFGEAAVSSAFLTAPVTFAPNLIVAVSSFAQRLTLSVGFTGGAENRQVIAAFLDEMEGILLAVAEKAGNDQ